MKLLYLLFLLPFQLLSQENEYSVYEINEIINKYQYIDDYSNWKVADYWSTPEEFKNKGGGDCEDYVIAKYYTLIDYGISKNNLYFLYSHINEIKHMTLLYKKNNKFYILDNRTNTIVPIENKKNYKHIFAFNTLGIFSIEYNKLELEDKNYLLVSKFKNLLERNLNRKNVFSKFISIK